MQAIDRLHPGNGIAVMRVVTGLVLFVAGIMKVMGPGVAGITGFFTNVGIPAPELMAPLVIGFEVVGGLLLMLGLFTRFIGAAMIVEFLVAGFLVSLPSQAGWNAARLDFLLVAAGALFLLAGAGAASVDAWIAGRRPAERRTATAAM